MRFPEGLVKYPVSCLSDRRVRGKQSKLDANQETVLEVNTGKTNKSAWVNSLGAIPAIVHMSSWHSA